MKKSPINKNSSGVYTGEPETIESTMKSRETLKSERKKAFKSGMFFPEKIIYQTSLDIQVSQNLWDNNVPVKLTTDAFNGIPISAIQKIKYYRKSNNGKLTFKIITGTQTYFFLVDIDISKQLFSKIAWGKLAMMNLFSDIQEEFAGKIEGTILKRGEILKKWQTRYVEISKQKGLQSRRDFKGQPTFKIVSTHEIWTRFQIIKQQTYLIIKLWYGIIKQQFAIPVEGAVEWLQAFCSLLQQKE